MDGRHHRAPTVGVFRLDHEQPFEEATGRGPAHRDRHNGEVAAGLTAPAVAGRSYLAVALRCACHGRSASIVIMVLAVVLGLGYAALLVALLLRRRHRSREVDPPPSGTGALDPGEDNAINRSV
jgi:hypothetical protein